LTECAACLEYGEAKEKKRMPGRSTWSAGSSKPVAGGIDQGRNDDHWAENRAVYVADSSRDLFIREKEIRADSHVTQSAALVKPFYDLWAEAGAQQCEWIDMMFLGWYPSQLLDSSLDELFSQNGQGVAFV